MVDVGHSRDNQDEEEEPGTREDTDKAAAGQEPDKAAETGSEGPPSADSEPVEDEAAKGGKSKKAKKKPRSFWKELPILIGIAIVLTIIIQSFIARVFLIPSESMEQTLHGCADCYGDRVLVDRVTYLFSDPEPGEVVVFERPSTWDRAEFSANRSSNAVVRWLQDIGAMFGLASPNEDDVVKRVIAVGGQTVECCDEQGRVQVDGKSLDEPYVYWGEEGAPDGRQDFAPIQVPDGMLWVMGDNRNHSADSRRQGGGGINGVVPVDNVIGKARFIVLPPSRWRGVGDHNPQTAVALAGVQFGIGFAAAFPTLWLGRRLRQRLTARSGSAADGAGFLRPLLGARSSRLRCSSVQPTPRPRLRSRRRQRP